jgi:F1F0 ATPase subunit 2
MNEYIYMTIALAGGMATGLLFFGGLWLTVKKSLASRTPALWLIGSFLLRSAVTMVGFYYLSGDDWRRLIICLVGFIIARTFIKQKIQLTKIKLAQTAMKHES